MSLCWTWEVLFCIMLLFAKFYGISFDGAIWWVPVFALVFGGAMFIFAFVKFKKAKSILTDAETASFYRYGCIASVMMCVEGIAAF